MRKELARVAASFLIGAAVLAAAAPPTPAAETAPDWEQLARGLDAPKAKDRLAAVQATAATGLERAAVYLQPILAADTDRDVRLAAAEALGRVPGEDAVTALGAGLGDDDLKVRRAIVESLRRRTEPSSVPFLTRALKDRKPVLRKAAVLALGTKLTADQAETLVPALSDTDSGVREAAIYALGTTGGETAIAALAKVVAGNENKKVRALAADVVGMMGSRSALPELEGALDGADDLVLRPSLNTALLRILGRTENRVAEEEIAKRAAPPAPEPATARAPDAPRAPAPTIAETPAPAPVPPPTAPVVEQSTGTVPTPASKTQIKARAVATEFKLKAQEAREVFLSGSFLRGDRKAMDPSVDGSWSATAYLRPGKYRYQFIVDGKKTADPEGKQTEGGLSVVTIAAEVPQP
jgi:HEAT repeat protein